MANKTKLYQLLSGNTISIQQDCFQHRFEYNVDFYSAEIIH